MDITLIHETLTYIHSILQDCKTLEEKRQTKYWIKTYGIVMQLHQL
jgi:hypothetical protein